MAFERASRRAKWKQNYYRTLGRYGSVFAFIAALSSRRPRVAAPRWILTISRDQPTAGYTPWSIRAVITDQVCLTADGVKCLANVPIFVIPNLFQLLT